MAVGPQFSGENFINRNFKAADCVRPAVLDPPVLPSEGVRENAREVPDGSMGIPWWDPRASRFTAPDTLRV